MLYDIPGRSGVPISTETLSGSPSTSGSSPVKDAKDDLGRGQLVHRPLRPRLLLGRRHAEPAAALRGRGRLRLGRRPRRHPALRTLVEAYVSGDVQKATEIHQKLLPVFTGMFRTQGVMTTKAALALQGLPAGPLRAPMVELSADEVAQLKIDLAAGGVQL